MYYYGQMPQNGCCQNYGYNPCCNNNNRGAGYALILVLFILLVIIGASRF